MHRRRSAKLVSFSGIDGAGKSTQIENLRRAFEERGLRVHVVAFWETIATLKQFRESAGHSIFKGDLGVGHPSSPIHRKDKNVQSFPMTLVRLFLYLLDALANRRAAKKAMDSEADVVIFDRYIYDELANLNLRNPIIRLYVKAILKIVPRPDIAYVLDADPEEARARKPEYPLEFVVVNRQSYLALSRVAGGMTIAPALPMDQVKEIVVLRTFKLLASEVILGNSGEAGRVGTRREGMCADS